MKIAFPIVIAVAVLAGLCTHHAHADIAHISGAAGMGTTTTDLRLDQSESGDLQLLDEMQDVVLGCPLTLDLPASYLSSLGGPWVYAAHGVPASAQATLPAGTVVRSHLVHFDPFGSTLDSAVATITFDEPILGLMVTDGSLNASDSLGLASITYPSTKRGLEGNSTYTDSLEFTLLSPKVLDVRMLIANTGLDQVRVITTPVPGGLLLGATGLGIVGWLKRRANHRGVE